jgi:hypothetical protein
MKNIKRIKKRIKMDVTTQTQHILKECVENILRECGLHANDAIDAIVANSLIKIYEANEEQVSDNEEQVSDNEEQVSYEKDMYDGMGVGNCCFCNDECNPMSQSCGSCMRGLSGGVFSIPVPGHLQKFM